MGNHENKKADSGQEFYCLKQNEIRIMSEIWKSVETDLAYYGSQFYSILFHNHPQYYKYFQESKPHEFQIDLPAMRSKFSLACSTLAALFVEYSHKSQARENLLGYVAMVHKDMNLTREDLENFMMDLMELLMNQFPETMTAECCLAYVRYTASLTSRLQIMMKEQRKLGRTNKGFSRMPKKDLTVGCFRSPYCGCLPSRKQDLIYGRPAEYWDKRSRYWILKRAVWATMDGKNRPDSSRNEIVPKKNDVNLPQMSITADSSSSRSQSETNRLSETIKRVFAQSAGDAVRDKSYSDQAVKNQTGRRKKQFRRQKNSFIVSNDDATDEEAKITPKSNESRRKKTNDLRHRRVSIVSSTARERRRRSLQREDNAEEYPHAVTIRKGIGTGKNSDGSSSLDEAGEKDIRSNSPESRNVAIEMRDRGTSISNMINRSSASSKYDESSELPYADEILRASSTVKSDGYSSIIGTRSSMGRNMKTNKRVSISNAQWIPPRKFTR